MIQLIMRGKQRRRVRQLIKQTRFGAQERLKRLLGIVVVIIVAHTVAMMMLEGLGPLDALWLTLTSMTTVGYGDISATTDAGRFATVLFIYVLGIWLLAQVAGEYLDYRLDRRDRMIKGQWSWSKMHDHLVIVNTPSQDSDRYLIRLVEQMRNTPELEDTPVQLLTSDYPDGLPTRLRELGVVHNQIPRGERHNLDDVNLEAARFVLVLARDADEAESDSVTFDLLERIATRSTKAYIMAESVLDENKPRFQRMGAHATMRPMRAYPEMIVREMAAPGTEEIMENLFTHHGDSAYRYNVPISAMPWRDVACRLISEGLGTPLGYVGNDGKVVTNPPAEHQTDAQAVILVARHDAVPEAEQVQRAIAGSAAVTG